MVTLFDSASGTGRQYPNESRFRLSPLKHGKSSVYFGSSADDTVGTFSLPVGFAVREEHMSVALKKLNDSLVSWLSSSDSVVFVIPDDILARVDWEQVYSDLGKERAVGHGREAEKGNVSSMPV